MRETLGLRSSSEKKVILKTEDEFTKNLSYYWKNKIHTLFFSMVPELYPNQEGQLRVFNIARCWWLMPIILATQEAEIRRIIVQSQQGQLV
jgi:hypothetical protein